MNEDITWIKSENFYNSRDGAAFHVVSYTNQKNSKQELSISEFRNNQIQMIFRAENQITAAVHKAACEAGCLVKPRDIIYKDVYLILSRDKKNDFAILLNIIEQSLSIKSIKKEIFGNLGITAIADEEAFYSDLEKLIESNNIQEARDMINTVDDDKILFKFAQLLESKEKLMEALEVYQDIPETNPCFRESNEAALKIILSYEENLDKELSPEEKKYYLESKVRLMLRADDAENQKILDNHFEKLAGGNPFEPVITNIKMDENTIISLGIQMARLRENNSGLQLQNQDLQLQNAALLAELAKLKAGDSSLNPHAWFKVQKEELKLESNNNAPVFN